MFNYKQICLKSKSDDSCYFGASVVINKKYIAVGDPGANRVVIYRRNRFNQWRRFRKILPPHNSVPSEVGNGFGQKLELDNNVLAIGALTQQRTKDVTNPEYFSEKGVLNSTFFGRYLTRIDRETEVHQIELKAKKGKGCVHFDLLSEGKIQSITLSDRGERGFGVSSALYKNLLLVGSPSSRSGGAWLFDLDVPENEPLRIFSTDFLIGETVAVSEQFAVVGNYGEWGCSHYWGYVEERSVPIVYSRTLIKSLHDGSTTTIKNFGKLSIDRNILTIVSSFSDDYEGPALLEVFKLDSNTTPHLILKREHCDRAWVQNGFLITVTREENSNSIVPNVCIESISSHQN